jgi:hypothetical protein
MDQALARILKRDGRRIYEAAPGDLLTLFAATIAHMDGGPKRLLGMLRRLEEMYVKLERKSLKEEPSRRPNIAA